MSMTFAQHMEQVRAVQDFDDWSVEQEEIARWEAQVDLATERFYEGDGRMDRCWFENQLDLARFDAEFPNGYCS